MTGRNRERPTNKNRDKDKDREIYAEIKAIPPVIVRVDGRNFKRVLSAADFEKPYDVRFAKGLAKATAIFFEKSGFDPKLAYIFSDEINLFFTQLPFKGRIEKLDSVIASFLASAVSIVLDLKEAIAFDARIIPVCGEEDVLGYLVQRQAEAWRNHINAYGYYGLQELGMSEEEAEKQLKGMKAAQVHEMLYRRGVNLNETPTWQRRGILIAKERFEKEGYDPKADRNVRVARYRVVQLWDLPLFGSGEGQELINLFLERKALPTEL